MSRILLRAAKAPWTPTRAEVVLAQRTIGMNIGNLVFGQSVHRTLSVPGAEIVTNSYLGSKAGVDASYAQRINDEFDRFVVPLANAFRPTYRSGLQRLTRTIKQLDMPVTVVGVGSQHKLDVPIEGMDPIAEDVQEFMAAVLDRSASVGVRGEMTAAYLKSLGFGDEHVDVIGCPSIFLNGPSPTVTKKVAHLDAASPVAMNVSPYVAQMAPIVERHAERYPHLIYIPQNHSDLLTMVWGENPESIVDARRPVHTDHRLFVEDRMRFPLDPRTWIEYLQGFDFAFGTRIHGTIASILAGTPAMLLAHDSRTLELAEYHSIPHLRIKDVSPDVDAADLFEQVDYSAFHAGLPEAFTRFTAFLEKNGLAHIYEPGNENAEFDKKLNDAQLPPMVHTLTAPGEAGRREMLARLQWLRQGATMDSKRTCYRFTPEFPHTPKAAGSAAEQVGRGRPAAQELAELKVQLAKTQKRLDRQAEMIKRLEASNPSALHRGRRFARRLRRRVSAVATTS